MIELIYDRTESDKERAQALSEKAWESMSPAEQTEWLTALRGKYGLSDLNRVGLAILTLRDVLTACGYSVNVTPKTDWTPQDIPTLKQMQDYLNNVRVVRSALSVPPDTPNVPGTMNNLTWQQANDIERILAVIEIAIQSMMSIFRPCGTFKCGTGLFFLTEASADPATHEYLEQFTHEELESYTYEQIMNGEVRRQA